MRSLFNKATVTHHRLHERGPLACIDQTRVGHEVEGAKVLVAAGTRIDFAVRCVDFTVCGVDVSRARTVHADTVAVVASQFLSVLPWRMAGQIAHGHCVGILQARLAHLHAWEEWGSVENECAQAPGTLAFFSHHAVTRSLSRLLCHVHVVSLVCVQLVCIQF